MINRIPNKEDIYVAYHKIKNNIHRTPVLSSTTINEMVGGKLFFKCENFQRVGAFKARGATNAALSLSKDQLRKGIATHSSGNHAQAIAYAASQLKSNAYVVMPNNSPRVKINAVEGYGAEIIFCEPTLEARERELKNIVKKTGAYFIHPYNDYDVIAGQATAAFELFDQVESLDVIITPVGGGGLLSGTCLARNYFSVDTKIYAGEPEGASDAFKSLEKGEIVPSINPDTVADGLLTSLGTLTFPIIQKNIEKIILVTDKEIIIAMRLIWERMKIIVEPSAAVSLAAVIKNKESLKNLRIGLILSGGNVDLNHLPF